MDSPAKNRTPFRVVLIPIAFVVCTAFIWHWRKELAIVYFNTQVACVTTSLPRCDRVEILHLSEIAGASSDMVPLPPAGENFPIRPYGEQSGILNRVTLAGPDAEAFANLWRSQKFDKNMQALCHDPVYAFRFYSGWRKTFETSVCFHCSNFYVDSLVGSDWWGFDRSTPQAKQLLQRFQELLPDSASKQKPHPPQR
jgi:hypothetical protein